MSASKALSGGIPNGFAVHVEYWVWLLHRRGMRGKKYHSGEGGGLVYFSNPLIRGMFYNLLR